MGIIICRIDFYRSIIRDYRIFQLTIVAERISKTIVGFLVPWIDFDCPTIRGNRLPDLALVT